MLKNAQLDQLKLREFSWILPDERSSVELIRDFYTGI